MQGPVFLQDLTTTIERLTLSATNFLNPDGSQLSEPALFPRFDFGVSATVLGGTKDPETVASEYFERIHWWMPIVSKKRFLEQTLHSKDGDVSLLLLSMRVLLWRPSQQGSMNPITSSYVTAKHAISEAVMVGTLSFHLLQAQILLVIYELGQAIYPAASLTLCSCAQYGRMMGIEEYLHPAYEMRNASIDPLEVEERRRTWWAVLILDR